MSEVDHMWYNGFPLDSLEETVAEFILEKIEENRSPRYSLGLGKTLYDITEDVDQLFGSKVSTRFSGLYAEDIVEQITKQYLGGGIEDGTLDPYIVLGLDPEEVGNLMGHEKTAEILERAYHKKIDHKEKQGFLNHAIKSYKISGNEKKVRELAREIPKVEKAIEDYKKACEIVDLKIKIGDLEKEIKEIQKTRD